MKKFTVFCITFILCMSFSWAKTYKKNEIARKKIKTPLDIISLVNERIFKSSCAVIGVQGNFSYSEVVAFSAGIARSLVIRRYRVYLLVPRSCTCDNITCFKAMAASFGIDSMHLAKVTVLTVPRISAVVVSEVCRGVDVFVYIGQDPIPKIKSPAAHGIYVSLQSEIKPDGFDVRYFNTFLSFDQVWLPSWSILKDYNALIAPVVNYSLSLKEIELWPVANAVILPSNEAHNDRFFFRVQQLIQRGTLESRLRTNFFRIPGISEPLQSLVRSNNNSKYAAAIYEGRIHYALLGVCLNVMKFLSLIGQWDLHVFHSVGNEAFVQSLFGEVPGVILHIADNSEISINKYNVLLTGESFWNQFLSYERVLIFQVDSFFIRPPSESFLQYQYIGAPWCLKSNAPARKQHVLGAINATGGIAVGNGGFSLRDPRAMIKCIKEFSPTFEHSDDFPEDLLFVICMKHFNMNIAPPAVAKQFALEQPCNIQMQKVVDTAALHAAWYCLSEQEFDTAMDRVQREYLEGGRYEKLNIITAYS